MTSESGWDSVPDRPDPEPAATAAELPPPTPAREPEPEVAVTAAELATAAEPEGDATPEAAPPDPEPGVEAAAEDVEDEDEGAGPAPASAADLAEATTRLDAIAGSVAELAALERRHAGLIEQLHAENTKLRQGELVLALRPLLLDITRLYDDVDAIVERGGDAHASAGLIRDLISDLLERHGVTAVRPERGDVFDPARHIAANVAETEDAALDTCIASVRKAGFVRDGVHVVRPAQVEVFRHVAASVPDPAQRQ